MADGEAFLTDPSEWAWESIFISVRFLRTRIVIRLQNVNEEVDELPLQKCQANGGKIISLLAL